MANLRIDKPRASAGDVDVLSVAQSKLESRSRTYLGVPLRQAFEQYFTSSQTFSHFLRHCIVRKQTMQSFSGRFDFATRFLLMLSSGLSRFGVGLDSPRNKVALA